MSMPKIPDINPTINIEREDAVNITIMSIAMEELALAHILNAEGEKLQYVLGTIDGRDPGEITICDIMAVNNSIQKTLKNVIKAEMLLQFKLEDIAELGDIESKTTIRGQKIWRDNNNINGIRPPFVQINLLRDGEVYKTVTVDSTGDGVYTFAYLPVWRDSENKYVYQIDEDSVPAGYIKTVSDFNIINTIEPGSITIEGTKTWVDNDNTGDTRPAEITVHLFQNGIQYRSLSVSSPPVGENTVVFSFIGVPQFDEEGNLFDYSIDEDDIAEYRKAVDEFDITNTLEIGPYRVNA